jgi:hypothetical protein
MVAHSAGGWLGSSAIDGLRHPECKKRGFKGVVGIVFFAAGIAPLNWKIEPSPSRERYMFFNTT